MRHKKREFDFGRVENILGKGEKAGYHHFLLFQQCFLKPERDKNPVVSDIRLYNLCNLKEKYWETRNKINKSIACRSKPSSVPAFSLNILSPKRGIILARINSELSPLFVHISHVKVNTYFEFQVYMFSNSRDMTKYQFLHDHDTKAIATPRAFSKKRAKNGSFSTYVFFISEKKIHVTFLFLLRLYFLLLVTVL